jgi:hypothetical protein
MAKGARPVGLSREALMNSADCARHTFISGFRPRAEAAGILLGAHFDHCDRALHYRSADARLAALCRYGFGGRLGALIAMSFGSNWIVYSAGIFVCGILSALLRLGAAYRFAAITLSVVLLIAHTRPPWIVATHRFVVVSLDIAVALLITAVSRMPVQRGE